MQVVVETAEFLRRAKECRVSDAERAEMVDFIAANPLAGDEISGTGGARKVRFAGKGKGKSGGHRVITFYSGEDIARTERPEKGSAGSGQSLQSKE